VECKTTQFHEPKSRNLAFGPTVDSNTASNIRLDVLSIGLFVTVSMASPNSGGGLVLVVVTVVRSALPLASRYLCILGTIVFVFLKVGVIILAALAKAARKAFW
jgi:hypothetical protein